MKHATVPLILSLFLCANAQASFLTPLFRLVGKAGARGGGKAAVNVATHGDDIAKIATHGDDIVKVATHGDDLAKVATHGDDLGKGATHVDDLGKGLTKSAGGVSARTAAMVDRAIEAERATARAATPAVKEIHRPPIVRPGNIAAGGAAAAAILGAHNLTVGEREKDEAIADDLKNHPEHVQAVADAQGGFWHGLGHGLGEGLHQGLVLLAGLLGGFIGLSALLRALPARRRRPAVIDVTPSISSDPR